MNQTENKGGGGGDILPTPISKNKQDFTDIIPILVKLPHDFQVSPAGITAIGSITININHGSNRQLVLTSDGKWSLK